MVPRSRLFWGESCWEVVWEGISKCINKCVHRIVVREGIGKGVGGYIPITGPGEWTILCLPVLYVWEICAFIDAFALQGS